MALSRPLYSLLGTYFEQMFNHPIRTKSITSCLMATSANYASQKIGGIAPVHQQSLLAYGLFGFVFGGTVPHYFYAVAERIVSNQRSMKAFVTFLMERLIYAPIFQVLSLYFLARFEGKNHAYAMKNLSKLFENLLLSNWKYLSLPVFINIAFVPPIFRVLVANLIGFFWLMFVATKRRQNADIQKRNADEVDKEKTYGSKNTRS